AGTGRAAARGVTAACPRGPAATDACGFRSSGTGRAAARGVTAACPRGPAATDACGFRSSGTGRAAARGVTAACPRGPAATDACGVRTLSCLFFGLDFDPFAVEVRVRADSSGTRSEIVDISPFSFKPSSAAYE
ncbi:hypothetical protein PFISCL1PPCAC_11806, partial [Pristionchus fissidentatus]